MPSFNNVEPPKDFCSVTIHPKPPSTPTPLSKPGAKAIFIPVVLTRAITKNKIKTFKSNNAHSIDGSKGSSTIFPRKKNRNPTSLLFIGVSATIFEIPARFVNKSYPSIPIPLGNPPLGIPLGAVSPVNVVKTQAVSSHPTNIVAVSVEPITHDIFFIRKREKKPSLYLLLKRKTQSSLSLLYVVQRLLRPRLGPRSPSPKHTPTIRRHLG